MALPASRAPALVLSTHNGVHFGVDSTFSGTARDTQTASHTQRQAGDARNKKPLLRTSLHRSGNWFRRG